MMQWTRANTRIYGLFGGSRQHELWEIIEGGSLVGINEIETLDVTPIRSYRGKLTQMESENNE